tara:strand:- start:3622 stop:3879 length:258 start_codon:yes stop_codon:yes gene_type:complete
MLDAFKKVSFEKNIEAESPKNENNKNNINGRIITLFLIKKNIRKTGINKGFVDCKNNAFSLTVPKIFNAIKRHKAPTNILLELIL